jgi:hypothetical protein
MPAVAAPRGAPRRVDDAGGDVRERGLAAAKRTDRRRLGRSDGQPDAIEDGAP